MGARPVMSIANGNRQLRRSARKRNDVTGSRTTTISTIDSSSNNKNIKGNKNSNQYNCTNNDDVINSCSFLRADHADYIEQDFPSSSSSVLVRALLDLSENPIDVLTRLSHVTSPCGVCNVRRPNNERRLCDWTCALKVPNHDSNRLVDGKARWFNRPCSEQVSRLSTIGRSASLSMTDYCSIRDSPRWLSRRLRLGENDGEWRASPYKFVHNEDTESYMRAYREKNTVQNVGDPRRSADWINERDDPYLQKFRFTGDLAERIDHLELLCRINKFQQDSTPYIYIVKDRVSSGERTSPRESQNVAQMSDNQIKSTALDVIDINKRSESICTHNHVMTKIYQNDNDQNTTLGVNDNDITAIPSNVKDTDLKTTSYVNDDYHKSKTSCFNNKITASPSSTNDTTSSTPTSKNPSSLPPCPLSPPPPPSPSFTKSFHSRVPQSPQVLAHLQTPQHRSVTEPQLLPCSMERPRVRYSSNAFISRQSSSFQEAHSLRLLNMSTREMRAKEDGKAGRRKSEGDESKSCDGNKERINEYAGIVGVREISSRMEHLTETLRHSDTDERLRRTDESRNSYHVLQPTLSQSIQQQRSSLTNSLILLQQQHVPKQQPLQRSSSARFKVKHRSSFNSDLVSSIPPVRLIVNEFKPLSTGTTVHHRSSSAKPLGSLQPAAGYRRSGAAICTMTGLLEDARVDPELHAHGSVLLGGMGTGNHVICNAFAARRVRGLRAE